ncbi:MAG: hotdog fold domain-containing protein [Steroidobacteraceae bacterium]
MNTEMATLRVPARFRGPPTSANGGYVCGLVGAAIGQLVTVRLLSPPPLDADMTLHADEGGTWHVERAAVRIVEARPASLDDLVLPAAVSYADAAAAARRAPWADAAQHPCPGCFVCGPLRAAGDGMRLFAGALPGQTCVATGWVPDASVGQADGVVGPQFMAAALDCPGFQALQTGLKPYLLGEFTCRIDHAVRVGETCVIVGWKIEVKGRRSIVGTALYNAQGELCALAKGVWIEPRETEARR